MFVLRWSYRLSALSLFLAEGFVSLSIMLNKMCTVESILLLKSPNINYYSYFSLRGE